MKNEENIYLGLDIGTDSVGYAVTDDKYKIMKYQFILIIYILL